MLFKMLGIENYWQQRRPAALADASGSAPPPDTAFPRPRQLFVTQSRVLADKVEEYFIRLLEPLRAGAGGDKDTDKDRTMEALLERKRLREDAGLVDRDEAGGWREELPARFSELQDAHFPMFITFDKVRRPPRPARAPLTLCTQLSALLEADLDIAHEAPDEAQAQTAAGLDALGVGAGGTSEYMLQRRTAFVSFDVFRDEYWPHFPQPLTKGLGTPLRFRSTPEG
jgi:hypothetical protein